MNRSLKMQFYFTAFVGLLVLANSASAQEYKVKVSRAAKVNDQYTTRVTGSVKQATQITVGGQVQPKTNDDFAFELQGVVKVLAVGEKVPSATRLTCKVDRLTRDGMEVYPAGTVITVELADGKANYTIDGNPADPKNTQVLATVLEMNDTEKNGTEDDIVGTDKPQSVGATWPINLDNLSKAMTAGGLPVDAADLKGESKLVSIKKLNDSDVMEVNTVATSDGFKKDLPQGAALSDGIMKIEVTDLVPVDVAMPLISTVTKMHLSMTMTMTTPQGKSSESVVVERLVNEQHDAVKQ